MIDSQHPSFDSQGSNEDGRPDVVQDCMTINTINVEPESPEEEIVKESKFHSQEKCDDSQSIAKRVVQR